MKLTVGKKTSGKKITKPVNAKKTLNGKKNLKGKKKYLNKHSADEFSSKDFNYEENGNSESDDYEKSLDKLASQDPGLDKFLLKNGKKSVSSEEGMSVDGDEDDASVSGDNEVKII